MHIYIYIYIHDIHFDFYFNVAGIISNPWGVRYIIVKAESQNSESKTVICIVGLYYINKNNNNSKNEQILLQIVEKQSK